MNDEEPYIEWAAGGKLRYVEPAQHRFRYLNPKEGRRFGDLQTLIDFIYDQYRFVGWLYEEGYEPK